MEKPLIIPIIGKARHGKDTFSLYLKEEIEKEPKNNVLIIRYADYLKFVCKSYFDWNGEKDERVELYYSMLEQICVGKIMKMYG